MKNGQSFSQIIKTVTYTVNMIWTYKKSYIFIKIFLMLFNSVIPLASVLLPGYIINEMTVDRRLNIVFSYVAILISVPVLQFIVNSIFNRIVGRQEFELNLEFQSRFFEHISRMDYEALESPQIQDMQGRARDTLGSLLVIMNQVFGLISSVISIAMMSAIISTLSLIVILMVLLVVFVNSKITKWVNNKQFEINKKTSFFSRYEICANTMITGLYFAKENRIFGMFPSLIREYKKKSHERYDMGLEMVNTQIKAGAVNTVLSTIQNFGVYAYLIYRVVRNKILVGNLTIYISAIGQFSGALGSVMSSYLGIGRQSLYVQDMMNFMNLPLRRNDTGKLKPEFNADSVIEFRNVSFRYPGSERLVLKNVNLKIRGNERLCIVGQNGAGKTTFIKLLLRFYFPTEGEILLNGVNINEYEIDLYTKLFSTVFQDYCHYYLTLSENITMASEKDGEKVRKIVDTIGIGDVIDQLPKGLDTQLGRMIDDDGVNFSGGEDQKLAIARAIYHNRPVYILDELTAALDPMAEYEIYTQFNNMITDKCAILITHRLSAVQLADKVAVFDNGHVVEYGTHAELYTKGGIYTEMFDKQARFYRDAPFDSDAVEADAENTQGD